MLLPPKLREELLDAGYEVKRHIGGSHFSNVYEATHKRTERRVAIKVPVEEQRDRFPRECALLQKFADVPHVIRVLSAAAIETPYLVMEYPDGQSLDALAAKGPLRLKQIDRILTQVVAALAGVHAGRVAHRDLKPHNLYIALAADDDEDGPADDLVGFVWLLDFGIALDWGPVVDKRWTARCGTPPYQAPETESQIWASGDIFSLAVVVLELIIGQGKLKKLQRSRKAPGGVWCETAEDREQLERLLSAALESRRRGGESITSEREDRILRTLVRALEFEPGDRPQTVEEFSMGFLPAPVTESAPLGVPESSSASHGQRGSASMFSIPIMVASLAAVCFFIFRAKVGDGVERRAPPVAASESRVEPLQALPAAAPSMATAPAAGGGNILREPVAPAVSPAAAPRPVPDPVAPSLASAGASRPTGVGSEPATQRKAPAALNPSEPNDVRDARATPTRNGTGWRLSAEERRRQLEILGED